MKVRLVKKTEDDVDHYVQIKRWWWPFWTDVYFNYKQYSEKVYNHVLETGSVIVVLKQGETK